VKLDMSYRDTTEMCASGGWRWIGDLLETAGLPLEILHIVNGRVYQVDAFDYEEGQEKPMTWCSLYWFEVLESPPPPPSAMPNAIIAVYPDGSWHTVAAK
jgi:hypothetical protein